MLFCSSFTQSECFLQTDQLITRLQVVVMTSFIVMLMRNVFVFKSDAVIWWAAIFRRVGASFVPVPFWDPSEAVRGSSRDFLERSRFVPWPFRGFSPEESPMASCSEDPVSDGGRCLLAHSCCRRPVLDGFGLQAGCGKFASIPSENLPAGTETL